MKSGMAKFTVAMLNSLLVSVLCFLPIAWIIRDGLGPGSVESNGYEAILKCFKAQSEDRLSPERQMIQIDRFV